MIEQPADASPPRWEASAALYEEVTRRLAATPGGADLDVECILRRAYPHLPDDVLDAAMQDLGQQLRSQGWSVERAGGVLVARRSRTPQAEAIYRATRGRLLLGDAAALLIATLLWRSDEILAALGSFFAGQGTDACAAGAANLTRMGATCNLAGALTVGIVQMLPLCLVMTTLAMIVGTAMRVLSSLGSPSRAPSDGEPVD